MADKVERADFNTDLPRRLVEVRSGEFAPEVSVVAPLTGPGDQVGRAPFDAEVRRRFVEIRPGEFAPEVVAVGMDTALAGSFVTTTTDQDKSGTLRFINDAMFKSGRPRFDARSFGATAAQRADFMNGLSKPLSGYYGSLGAAQAAYPIATALTDELDWVISQTAIDASMTTGAPASIARLGLGPLYFDQGVAILNRPLKVYSVLGFYMQGAGYRTEFRCKTGTTMTNVFDMNGVSYSVIGNFRANGPVTSGQVDAVIDWYYDTTSSNRGSSGCHFENIWIGGDNGRFLYGFGLSRLSNGARQVDNSVFSLVTVTGGGRDDATFWKRAWHMGSGSAGNQTDLAFNQCGVANCDTAYYLSAVKNLTFNGGSCGGINTLVYVNGSFDFSFVGFNMENIGRLIDGVGATNASSTVKFSNITCGPSSVILPADGEWIRYYMAGSFILEGIRIHDVLSGPASPSYHFRFNTVGSAPLKVQMRGVQVPDTLETVLGTGMISGNVSVEVSGYSRWDRSTALTVDPISGPLLIPTSQHTNLYASRQPDDAYDRHSTNRDGVQSWGTGAVSPDTTLARTTGGGLAMTGGGFRINGHSTVHSVTGVPGSGVGANGDFAIRDDGTAGATLYHKRSGSWVAVDTIPSTGVVANVYTTPGTTAWSKPSGSVTHRIIAMSAGGGGGSGRKGAAGTARVGGGGGGSGGFADMTLQTADLASSVNVTVGAGGTAGAAVTADSTNGNNGGSGGASQFGDFATAYLYVSGGVGGTGGQSGAGGTGGLGGNGATSGATGGAAPTSGGAGAVGIVGLAGSGAAGGGITTGDVASAGGQGGGPTGRRNTLGGAGGAAGAAGSAGTSSGADHPGGGGGGGGSNTSGNGGAGGAGVAGSGGGGGGAALDAVGNSGAGGAGGNGFVVVLSFLG